MLIRHATLDDWNALLTIYARARAYMAETGNPHQWGNTTPTPDALRADIAAQQLYVLADDCLPESPLLGAFALLPAGDPIYETLDGTWLNNAPHAAIHRVASAGLRGGILAAIVDYCFSRAENLKIDTHPDNRVMQHLLEKLGFTRCGTVTYPTVGLRIAYQGIRTTHEHT